MARIGGRDEVDAYVGARIGLRRSALGLSQSALAQQLGISFQQVQKYERAANRVSASKLWEMARALDTSVAYFYEGLAEGSATRGSNSPSSETVQDFLLTPEGMELAQTFPRISQPRVRRKILELVRVMAGDPAVADA